MILLLLFLSPCYNTYKTLKQTSHSHVMNGKKNLRIIIKNIEWYSIMECATTTTTRGTYIAFLLFYNLLLSLCSAHLPSLYFSFYQPILISPSFSILFCSQYGTCIRYSTEYKKEKLLFFVLLLEHQMDIIENFLHVVFSLWRHLERLTRSIRYIEK